MDYQIPVVDIEDFKPGEDDKSCCGFIDERDILIKRFESYKLKYPPLIHPRAYIGSNSKLGEGVVIGPQTAIAPNCKLGNFSLINRGSSLGHDTVLGEFVTISPGVSIAGMVEIESKTTVGIGATIIDEITIGKNSFVGAGGVVVKDVPDNVLVMGVPAKIVKKRDEQDNESAAGYTTVPQRRL